MRLDLDDGEHDEEVAINLTPMLDMVFNLLLFFLAATTFAREEVALDLRLPHAKSGQAGKEQRPLTVNLLADGKLSVDGRDVTMQALQQKLQAAGERNPEQAVLLRGDQVAHFGIGVQVLDACRIAKIKKVDFAALPLK
jgi:biopolymer transport protein ExbD